MRADLVGWNEFARPGTEKLPVCKVIIRGSAARSVDEKREGVTFAAQPMRLGSYAVEVYNFEQ
jgi:hypothetical protein